MHNFLEKLVYMILPNQIGFEGVTAFQVCEGVGVGEAPREQPRLKEEYHDKMCHVPVHLGCSKPKVDLSGDLGLIQTGCIDTRFKMFPCSILN